MTGLGRQRTEKQERPCFQFPSIPVLCMLESLTLRVLRSKLQNESQKFSLNLNTLLILCVLLCVYLCLLFLISRGKKLFSA